MTDLGQKLLAGAITGFGSAAVTDLHALTAWTNWEDVRGYRWDVATFRWVQGALTGAAMALGLGQFL